MLLSSFGCPFWDRNQLPDPFFPSTCWITSYFNNLKMKTMKYCMMENCEQTSIPVWEDHALSQLGGRSTCLGNGVIHVCNTSIDQPFPRGLGTGKFCKTSCLKFQVCTVYHNDTDWCFSGAWLCKKILCIPLVRPFSFQSTSVALLSFKNKTIALNTASERLLWNRSLDLEERFSWQQCCNSFASKWLQPSSPQKLDQQSQRLHSECVPIFTYRHESLWTCHIWKQINCISICRISA